MAADLARTLDDRLTEQARGNQEELERQSRKQEATRRRLRVFFWLLGPLAASGLLKHEWTPVVAPVIRAISGYIETVNFSVLVPVGAIAGAVFLRRALTRRPS